MKILIIDDDEWIRDSLKIFFEAENCHAVVLETAEEGLAELKYQAYDLIIVDYKLPGMDGLDRRFGAVQPLIDLARLLDDG